MTWKGRSPWWLTAFALACGGGASDGPGPADAGLEDSGVALDAGSDAGPGLDGGDSDASSVDSGAEADVGADAGPLSPYGPVPYTGDVPTRLEGDRWREHWVRDIRPFWMQDEALGDPPGNFPTYRGRNGSVQPPLERRPRMLARQIYAYSMGYLLTGEVALLERADLGFRWLMDRAVDPRGGCHERLSPSGAPIDGPKYAQDLAYCGLGMASYYFVTRNREAEAGLLALRDLLFDPERYFDAEAGRIRDGATADLSEEVDQEGDGGWELVAQLDAVNAMLLLVQPVLHDPTRRAQLLGDLEQLGQAMVEHFFEDGIFWGVSTRKGAYGTRHVDFGHTLKTYWMLLEIDKRLSLRAREPGEPEELLRPFGRLLETHLDAWLERAHDGLRWKKRPLAPDRDESGSDWWSYAEAQQLAATRNFASGRWTERLDTASGGWLDGYVDFFGGGEVFSGLRPNGQAVYVGPPTDTFKCNLWKNGYHSTEHALVMYLHGRHIEGLPARLHFAVPEDEAESFPARPYFFHGEETLRVLGSTVSAGRRQVLVDFDQLW